MTAQKYTQGTGPQTIDHKYIVDQPLPVQSNSTPNFNNIDFTNIGGLKYQALLYEVQDQTTMHAPVPVSPNWFGVAIPDPANFDVSSGDVYVILYFHPTPAQAKYNNDDYAAKTGSAATAGHPAQTDWKQLFAYADRLGGQMTAAMDQYNTPRNRLVIFPFLEDPSGAFSQSQPYNLPQSEWGNIIHDILQDINTNFVNRICTTTKKVVVATLSDGSIYLNHFLDAEQSNQGSIFSNIVEVWDFDSEIARTKDAQGNWVPLPPVDPHGKPLRRYWQNPPGADPNYVQLPGPSSWSGFHPPAEEVPPLPPKASNSNSPGDPPNTTQLFHHYIRDTMFLDAVARNLS